MDDLKLIKRHYGENMMHLCRELFPTLLDTPGVLFNLMSKKFAYSRLLYDDIKNHEEEFKIIIYSMLEPKEENIKAEKTPKELLDEAGYILYECHSEEDIQSFRKYYAEGEELCTFRGGRLNRCYVFFAVKKNVDEIKRENFMYPRREDEYGTSVMSIQFQRGNVNSVSIKNRYNHAVEHPDSTYGNDLDKIVEGLTDAFEKAYRLNTRSKSRNIEIPGYVVTNDGKYYKYNHEIDNVYYCPNNVIIDNFEAQERDKSRYLVFEYFEIDMQEKTITSAMWDSFIDEIQDNIEKVEIINNKEDETKTVLINDYIKIVLNKENKIIEYYNDRITEIGDDFLTECSSIEKISLPNVKKIGNDFLTKARHLKELDLPNVEEIGDSCVYWGTSIERINLPKLKTIGDNFITMENSLIKEVNLPNVEKIGDCFLDLATDIENINFPNVKSVGHEFLKHSRLLESISLPKVEKIGNNFLGNCTNISSVDLPNVKIIENGFLTSNACLESLNLPNVEEIGNTFMFNAQKLSSINLPKLKSVANYFLADNKLIKELVLPELETIGQGFMFNSKSIEKIELPKVSYIDDEFLKESEAIQTLILPSVTEVGWLFAPNACNSLTTLIAPLLTTIGGCGIFDKTNKITTYNLPEWGISDDLKQGDKQI